VVILLHYSGVRHDEIWNIHAENALLYETSKKTEALVSYSIKKFILYDNTHYYKNESILADQIRNSLIVLRGDIDNIRSTWEQMNHNSKNFFCNKGSYEKKLLLFLRIMGHSAAHNEATVTDEALKNFQRVKQEQYDFRKKKTDYFEPIDHFKMYTIPRNDMTTFEIPTSSIYNRYINKNIDSVLDLGPFLNRYRSPIKKKHVVKLNKIQKQLDHYAKFFNCDKYPFLIHDFEGYTNFYYYFLKDLYN